MKAKLFSILLATTLLATACSSDQTTRSDEGEIVEGGELGVFAVQEGDCINFPDDANAGVSFDALACTDPHDGEIYELFDITGFDEFPGETEISARADEGCLAAFEPFVGIDYNSSVYYYTFLSPSEGSWENGDDREVICLLVPETGAPQLTQSLEGIAA